MHMDKYFITISRQYGSGGCDIALRMSELLNIPCYDREIVEEAAVKLNLSVSDIDKNEESAKKLKVFHPHSFSASIPISSRTTKEQDKIFDAQAEAIRGLAEKGSAIFVGRSADLVLEDEDNLVNIFIYAPYDVRVAHIMKRNGIKANAARNQVDRIDEARNEYRAQYSGYRYDDKRFWDIMIDSNFLGIEKTAEFLAEAIRKRFE